MRHFPARGIFHVAVDDHRQYVMGLQDVVPLSTETVFSHVSIISTFVFFTVPGKRIGRLFSKATCGAAKTLGFSSSAPLTGLTTTTPFLCYLSQGFRVISTAQKHALVQGQYLDEVLLEKFLD